MIMVSSPGIGRVERASRPADAGRVDTAVRSERPGPAVRSERSTAAMRP